MNLYELATKGSEQDVRYDWIDATCTSADQFNLLNCVGGKGSVARQKTDELRRMHMLFVWWATQ